MSVNFVESRKIRFEVVNFSTRNISPDEYEHDESPSQKSFASKFKFKRCEFGFDVIFDWRTLSFFLLYKTFSEFLKIRSERPTTAGGA